MNMCPVVSPPFKASLLSHVPFYHTNLVINVSRISARAHLRRGDGVEPERGRRGARGGAGMMREVKSAIVYLEVNIDIPSPLRFLTSFPPSLLFFDNLYNRSRPAPVKEPFCVSSFQSRRKRLVREERGRAGIMEEATHASVILLRHNDRYFRDAHWGRTAATA